jgi:hypothetical protein
MATFSRCCAPQKFFGIIAQIQIQCVENFGVMAGGKSYEEMVSSAVAVSLHTPDGSKDADQTLTDS